LTFHTVGWVSGRASVVVSQQREKMWRSGKMQVRDGEIGMRLMERYIERNDELYVMRMMLVVEQE